MPGNLWKAMDERKKKKKRIKGTRVRDAPVKAETDGVIVVYSQVIADILLDNGLAVRRYVPTVLRHCIIYQYRALRSFAFCIRITLCDQLSCLTDNVMKTNCKCKTGCCVFVSC